MENFALLGCIILGAFLTGPHISSAASCTVNEYDVQDINSAIRDCSDIILKSLHIPSGETLQLPMRNGTRLIFKGTTTWGYKEWRGPLVNISGTNIDILGYADSSLDGRGYLWWDGSGEHAGTIKPEFFMLHKLINATLVNLVLLNSPLDAIWIHQSDNVRVLSDIIDNSKGDDLGGQNTNGIKVQQSHNILIDLVAVHGQGDCITIKSGTNITINSCFCLAGHGVSIGPVGGSDDNVVENVIVNSTLIQNSENGVTIKTVYQGNGSVTNVTYKDIFLSDIRKFGIVIEGDITPTGDTTGIPTDGVPITNLFLDSISGNVLSTGDNIYVLVQNASNWYWSGIGVTGGRDRLDCQGIPLEGGAHC